MKKIGVLTGGADCPGLNSVIRSVVRKAMIEGYVVTGIKNGWIGLVENDTRILDLRATTGILDRGGTILGTSRLVPPLDPEQAKLIYRKICALNPEPGVWTTLNGNRTKLLAAELISNRLVLTQIQKEGGKPQRPTS